MSYLVDTCVVSELIKPSPVSSVVEWFEAAAPESLFISVITLGEIRKGVENLPQGRRRDSIENWLENDLHLWFEGRTLPIDDAVADDWGRLLAQSPVTLPAIDALIAATALRHRLTVITRNVFDFSRMGVAIINPWDDR